MSGPGSFQQGQLPSPGLSVNLSSNNPFRNRAASPASLDAAFASPTTSPFDDTTTRQRPVSRNPFLDNPEQPLKSPSPGFASNRSEHKSLSAEDIFDSLTLDDKMPNDRLPPALTAQRRPSDQPSAPRVGNPQLSNNIHRPTRSQEEALRAKKPPPGTRPEASRSPQRKPPPQNRPRRNSDSSVMDFNALPITPEEMKMIEAKRLRDRQREKVARESREPREGRDNDKGKDKERDGKSRSKSGRPSRRMDIIDQLDATSIYGTGLFHHDGPFDALNPHRNRNTSRRAPMQAFPKDSLNNSLGGAGPLNRNPDHAQFMGNGTDEAFRDYAGSSNKNKNGYTYPAGGSSAEPAIFDPISRGTVVHGDESYGLGTSTFLEGAPAARAAIVRRQAEQQQEISEGGLQRKKSLAQRIRHINKGPREFAPSGRMTNPDGVVGKRSPDAAPLGSSFGSEPNPFFSEFSKGEESITLRPRDTTRSPVSPPSIPRRMSGSALERRATTDAATSVEDAVPAKSSGLLGRMKSLKGGRRPKNSDTEARPAAPGMAM
ncbi:hypothetical protein QQS21_012088 [Conoideocrella luteorostrata]|uniref:Pal1 cell morphology protein n=1 Tax=Conoideocrella luteorostrata TaxID=1105319 RepID=A0AAJ0CEK9_9HYPO|nr:hypothetical protein QQS21_012088 [Conoideocrella luteorostrata]